MDKCFLEASVEHVQEMNARTGARTCRSIRTPYVAVKVLPTSSVRSKSKGRKNVAPGGRRSVQAMFTKTLQLQ